MAKALLVGEIMVTSMKAVGRIGLGGVTAGHGEMAVQAVKVPVSVGGVDVAPPRRTDPNR